MARFGSSRRRAVIQGAEKGVWRLKGMRLGGDGVRAGVSTSLASDRAEEKVFRLKRSVFTGIFEAIVGTGDSKGGTVP